MKYNRFFMTVCLPFNFFGFTAYAQEHTSIEDSDLVSKETIVFMRHGEKSGEENGQMNCQGLNRALKLPRVLLEKFGKPDYLFAPNPTEKVLDKASNESYFYTRPVIALEPLAIRIAQPVNLSFGYTDIDDITKELKKNKYKNSLVFVTWEHKKLVDIAKNIYELDSTNRDYHIPKWEKTDFDSLYILELYRNKNEKIKEVIFKIDAQNLNGLSETCPS